MSWTLEDLIFHLGTHSASGEKHGEQRQCVGRVRVVVVVVVVAAAVAAAAVAAASGGGGGGGGAAAAASAAGAAAAAALVLVLALVGGELSGQWMMADLDRS